MSPHGKFLPPSSSSAALLASNSNLEARHNLFHSLSTPNSIQLLTRSMLLAADLLVLVFHQ